MPKPTLNEIAAYFDGVTRRGSNCIQARCPVHDDKRASLSITETKDTFLFYCHAGCSTSEVLNAVGLEWSDLYEEKRNIPPWKRDLVAEYKYYSVDGKYLYSKLRYPGKKIMQGVVTGDILTYKIPADIPPTLYNLKSFLWAKDKGIPVYYCEGEKDVNTLKKLGLFGVTAGSCSDWKKEHSEFFKGAKLTILQDNDEAGEKLTAKMLKDLKEVYYSIRVVVPSEKEHGDVTDYIEEGHSKEGLIDLIDETPLDFAPWVYIVNEGKANEKKKIHPATLHMAVINHADWLKVMGNTENDTMLFLYKEGVYSRLGVTEVKQYIRQYIPNNIVEDDSLRNTYKLLTSSSIENINVDYFNKDESIINLKNGIYDLSVKRLLPHDPKHLSTLQLNCNFGAQVPKKWTDFVDALCTDDNGKVDENMVLAIQEWTGLMISNIPGYKVKKAFILYSPVGNTGKSVFLNVISKMIGEKNTASISFQALDSDRWALGRAYGKRLIVSGDQSSMDVNDSSNFKKLTGGDIVCGEFKGLQQFDYTFKGVMMVACNRLPYFSDDKGNHLIDRLQIYHCRNSIPGAKQNRNLLNELTEVVDGIFTWALEGLLRLQNNNFEFTEVESALQVKDDYRKRTDTVYYFLTTHYEITDDLSDRVKRAGLYEKYYVFCAENEYRPVVKKNFQDRVQQLGINVSKYGGVYMYKCLKPKAFIEVEDDTVF